MASYNSNNLAVKRGPARENEAGDLVFTCTVPAESKARFFGLFPEFDLILGGPAAATPENPPGLLKPRLKPDPAPTEESAGPPAPMPKSGTLTDLTAGPGPVQTEEPEAMVLAVDGLDGFTPGMTTAPDPEVMRLIRDPLFQEYAIVMKRTIASEVEDSEVFALTYLQEKVGRELTSITRSDLSPVIGGLSEYLRSRG
jgi:hypothetical protein